LSGTDIDTTKLTLKGDGDTDYTLVTAYSVDRDSTTQFSINLNATDISGLKNLMNKNGLNADSGTTYDVTTIATWNGVDTTADTTSSLTVSGVPKPSITSSAYNATSNVLVVTGENLRKRSGAINDIDISKLTVTGEDGATFILVSDDVEIDSATQFTLTLNTADKAGVLDLFNKNGTQSDGNDFVYNLSFADAWNGLDSTSDATNAVDVSSVPVPTIEFATTYDYTTGILVVASNNLASKTGNDIDVSNLRIKGEGGASYTLVGTYNIEKDSRTQFSVALNDADKIRVAELLNKNALEAFDGVDYDLYLGGQWNGDNSTTDSTFGANINGISVSNYQAATIDSATFDHNANELVVTGQNFIKLYNTEDFDTQKITIKGDNDATYTLVTAYTPIERDSATQFSVTLNATDNDRLVELLDKDGTTPNGGTAYNLNFAASWNGPASTQDTTASIVVSNYIAPTITTVIYDYVTGSLQVSANNLMRLNATDDIDVSALKLTGLSGNTYTLTGAYNIEIDSATQFTVMLNALDMDAVGSIFNQNGNTASTGHAYQVSMPISWNGNASTVSNSTNTVLTNYTQPGVISAIYDYTTGSVIVTGANIVSLIGNDINPNKLTITGESGVAYQFTGVYSVEKDSNTQFSFVLSDADKNRVDELLNKDGTTSVDNTTYNLKVSNNWNGVSSEEDLTNTLTVQNFLIPTVTAVSYNYTAGTMLITGSNFVYLNGINDIDTLKIAIRGEDSMSYTLSAYTLELDSATQFGLTLNTEDKIRISELLNKDGYFSVDNTEYRLIVKTGWNGAASIFDDSNNGINVGNYLTPVIASSAYNHSTYKMIVTGQNFIKLYNESDFDATKLTIEGDESGTYALTGTYAIERASSTEFSLTLDATDRVRVVSLLDKNGVSAIDATAYNLKFAQGWNGNGTTIDATNQITVSNYQSPAITSASPNEVVYDYTSGSLIVTGVNLTQLIGDDIDPTVFVLKGEAGKTYQLTTTGVEVESTTRFSVLLNSADQVKLAEILNKNGLLSASGDIFEFNASGIWNGNASTVDNANALKVQNYLVSTISSVTYDYQSGSLVATGTNLIELSATDIDTTKIKISGEAGVEYQISTAYDVEIDSSTQFSLSLNATDKLRISELLNKNGLNSDDATAYNVKLENDWNGASSEVDAINTLTLSNYQEQTITNAVYDYLTGSFVVTGVNLISRNGVDDINTQKITIKGEANMTYTIATAYAVEIDSSTQFSFVLNLADKERLNEILNKNLAQAQGGQTYNISFAEDWNGPAAVSDVLNNDITVQNHTPATVVSATYDYSDDKLLVTGSNFVNFYNTNDISTSKLNIKGFDNNTYTISTDYAVEVDSSTQFSFVLNATDKTAIKSVLNKNGTSSSDAVTYNLTVNTAWNGVYATQDASNEITVSNYAAPNILSISYNYALGSMLVTAENLVALGADDIDATKLVITGEANNTYQLTTTGVEVTSSTQFTIILNTSDKVRVSELLNKDGLQAGDGATSYKLIASNNWNGVTATLVDKPITVEEFITPSITSAIYDYAAGSLQVTGANLITLYFSTDDVNTTKFVLSGEGGATYQLSLLNADITSNTLFEVTLNATDKLGVSTLFNKNGTQAIGLQSYNLNANASWNGTGAFADTVNTITVQNFLTPEMSSAAYDYATGSFVVTGVNLVSLTNDDIDTSKMLIKGENGATYQLSTVGVEVDSSTQFTIALNSTDRVRIEEMLNANGLQSNDGTNYRLTSASEWNGLASPAYINSRTILVSNYVAPSIVSAKYDYATSMLKVTVSNIIAINAGNDIDTTNLVIKGQGGATYVLTSTYVIERDSSTQFSIALTQNDKIRFEGLFNKDGTSAADATVYKLSMNSDNWNGGASVIDADNDLTVTNYVFANIARVEYDYTSGSLVVTGTNFVSLDGSDDISLDKLTLQGEGNSYTLTTANIEITSSTQFSVLLNLVDQTQLDQNFGQNGDRGLDANLFNMKVASTWNGAGSTVDNTIAVEIYNHQVPNITSAIFDYSTGSLLVTGTDLIAFSATDDIVSSKITIKGEAASDYTLIGAYGIEVNSSTQFGLTLNATDLTGIESLLNRNGTQAADGATTYNIAFANDWNGTVSAVDSTNALTVNNYEAASIVSAVYDYTTGELSVTGDKIISLDATDDIKLTTLSIFGGSGSSYTLTTAGVEKTSATEFVATLNATDKMRLANLLNKNGSISASAQTYSLNATSQWNGIYATADSNNTLTVVNYLAPSITSATFDYTTGSLSIVGANLISIYSEDDIDSAKLSVLGDGGVSYQLTTSNLEVASSTSFIIALNDADKAALITMMNKNGVQADDGVTNYNFATSNEWNGIGATADSINSLNLVNRTNPTIATVVYDYSTNILTVEATDLIRKFGATDIDNTKLVLTGENGATHTLSTGSLEASSSTQFSVTLNATDRLKVSSLFNINGTRSNDLTTYQLSASDDWNGQDSVALSSTQFEVRSLPKPEITTALYNHATGSLIVTGVNLLTLSSTDIVSSKFTITGESGATHTLTSLDVELQSATQFTIAINTVDLNALSFNILNKNGSNSEQGSVYALSTIDGWNTTASTADSVTSLVVEGLPLPSISSAVYDFVTGSLVVTGANFRDLGVTDNLDSTKFTVLGENSQSHTLVSYSSEIVYTSSTQFTIALNAADKLSVKNLFTINGTQANDTTAYTLSVAALWNGSESTADSDNEIALQNRVMPTITNVVYNMSSGKFIIIANDLIKLSTSDVDVSKFTITGEGGSSSIVTTTDVNISNENTIEFNLSSSDKLIISNILDEKGTKSSRGVAYNFAATTQWNSKGAALSSTNTIRVIKTDITSATYNKSNGALVVSVTEPEVSAGPLNDIIANQFVFIGEGGLSYQLTTTSNIETNITATQFILNLSAADQAGVFDLLNANGTFADDTTAYTINTIDSWNGTFSATDNNNALNVSGVTLATVLSATYDVQTNSLVVATTSLNKKTGNDVDTSKLLLTGDGGATQVLSVYTVERDSATQFTLNLNATDQLLVNALLNRNGTQANDSTTYNISAMAGWNTTATASDATNEVSVSGIVAPSIVSASYDLSTGSLVVTATNLISLVGSDVSIAQFSITGDSLNSYTLTSGNVEISSSTQFVVTLNASDKIEFAKMLNKTGTSSDTGIAYTLSANVANWNGLASGIESNKVLSASNIVLPSIVSATYDYQTGSLTVSANDLLSKLSSDIDTSKLTLVGESGTHTLSAYTVEKATNNEFNLVLNATDQVAVAVILNKNGTVSENATTYTLNAAAGWNTSNASTDSVNAVALQNRPLPIITSVVYDVNTGSLTVNAKDLVSLSGSDITVSELTVTGKAGETYTLTTNNIEVESLTKFVVSLNTTDQTKLRVIFDEQGLTANDATPYNLAFSDNWNGSFVNPIASNAITVIKTTIDSAIYNAQTKKIVVTGSGLNAIAGGDITAIKIIITGESPSSSTSVTNTLTATPQTYVLSTTPNPEISSSTQFTLSLSVTDNVELAKILNNDGTHSDNKVTYNIQALAGWNGLTSAAEGVNPFTVTGLEAMAFTEILEDSATVFSFGDAGFGFVTGNANAVKVTFAQIQNTGVNQQKPRPHLEVEYQAQIALENNFSYPPTLAEIQVIINRVNDADDIDVDDRSPVASDGIIPLDDDSRNALTTAKTGLEKLIAKEVTGVYQTYVDKDTADSVIITSGSGAQRDGKFNIDGNVSSVEAYISIDGDNKPEFLWNPTDNTLEEVNLEIASVNDRRNVAFVVNDTTDATHDILGYDKGSSKAIVGATNRTEFSGTTEISGHTFTVWAYSGGSLKPVTGVITAIGNNWTVKSSDYIRAMDFDDNIMVLKGSISLPLPIVVTEDITVVKTANKTEVVQGEIVTYTDTIKNISGSIQNNISVTDDLPAGFAFIEGTGRFDGVAITPTKIGTRDGVQFHLGTLSAANTDHVITYQVRVSVGANYGDYVAKSVAVDNKATLSNIADDIALSRRSTHSIKVVPDAFFDLATIIGKVFNDTNGNGIQDEGEMPVPYAKLWTSSAQAITTDKNGQYHLANVEPGFMSIELNKASLPNGTQFVTTATRIVEVRAGIPAKVNFAVQIAKMDKLIKKTIIEQMISKPKVMMNIAAFGAGDYDERGVFNAPVKLFAYTNFAAFVDSFKVVITKGVNAKVVQEIKGDGNMLFTPIVLSSMMAIDNNWSATSGAVYSMHLEVSDAYGNVATTSPKRLELNAYNEFTTTEVETASLSYPAFFNQLIRTDVIDKQEIRITGKGIRVVKGNIQALRVYKNNKLILNMPIYDTNQTASDLLSQEVNDQATRIEFILPRGEVEIKTSNKFVATGVATTLGGLAPIVQKQVETNIVKPYKSKSPVITEVPEILKQEETEDDEEGVLDSISNTFKDLFSSALDLVVTPAYAEETKPTTDQASKEIFSKINDTMNEMEAFIQSVEAPKVVKNPESKKEEEVSVVEPAKKDNEQVTIKQVEAKEPEQVLVKKVTSTEKTEKVAEIKTEIKVAEIKKKTETKNLENVALNATDVVTISLGETDILKPRVEQKTNQDKANTILIENKTSSDAAWNSTKLNVGGFDTNVKGKEMLIVGIMHGEIGYRKMSGNIELASKGDNSYPKKIYRNGKIQIYFKGTIKGKYLVTASIDTERKKGELYKKLDPEHSYAIYGDESNVTDLSLATDGPIYLMIEKDESFAKWGKLSTAFEGATLSAYNKTFQGGQWHYESLESDAHGKARTLVEVFGAEVESKSAHNEMLSTGGKLYFLKHKEIMTDSLKVKIIVRDKISNNVISEQALVNKDDFEFDTQSGQIVLFKASDFYAKSGLIIVDDESAGDKVYVVADYQYKIKDKLDKVTYGVRAKHALNDKFTLGVTHINETRDNANYELNGVDATLYPSKKHTVKLEYAKSRASDDNTFISTNGGITWTEVVAITDDKKGEAYTLNGDVAITDKTKATYYYKNIESNFSSSTSEQVGEESLGFDLSHQQNDEFNIRLKHDTQKQVTGGSLQVNADNGAKTLETTTLQASYNFEDTFTVTGEVRHQSASEIDANNVSIVNSNEDVFALNGNYKFSDDTNASVTQQVSVKSNSSKTYNTTLGLSHKVFDGLSIDASVTNGKDNKKAIYNTVITYSEALNTTNNNVTFSGAINTTVENGEPKTSSSIGVKYDESKGTSYSAALTDTRDSGSNSQGVTLSTEQKLADNTTLGYSTGLGIAGEDQKNSHSLNVKHKVNEEQSISASLTKYNNIEQGIVSDGLDVSLSGNANNDWGVVLVSGKGYVHRLDGNKDRRTNHGFTLSYADHDANGSSTLKGKLALEKRSDRGEAADSNKDQRSVRFDIKGKYDRDITLFANFDWSRTKDRQANTLVASDNRTDIGFTYRPVMNDELNVIAKYTKFDNQSPAAQSNTAIGLEEVKGEVFSADVLYDVSPEVSLGARFAYRLAEEKIANYDWQNSDLVMSAIRVNYKLDKSNGVNLEYRSLKDRNLGDTKNGYLIEYVHYFGEDIRAAIGYNQSGYNTDLADLDYNVKDIYIRATKAF
jgi:hypothetical protein